MRYCWYLGQIENGRPTFGGPFKTREDFEEWVTDNISDPKERERAEPVWTKTRDRRLALQNLRHKAISQMGFDDATRNFSHHKEEE